MPSRNALLALVCLAWVAAAPSARAQAPAAPVDPGVKEVQDCLRRNIPKSSSVQTVQFKSVDRIGGERTFRGKMLGARMDDGNRRAKLCINQPAEMRGSEVLSIESNDGRPPETFLYTTELRKVKRITGEGTGGSLFGTDFTYEDMQRIQQLNRPDRYERLPDAEVEGHPVYVLQSKPIDQSTSAYTKVISYVDKSLCVVLKSESYENGDRLRRVLTAKPDGMFEEHGIYAPTEVVMKDVRDETHTTVAVEEFEVDGDVDRRSFEQSTLGRHCR
jgi:hypothetical protein